VNALFIQKAKSKAALAELAAQFIAESATAAIADRGRFAIALAGGSTPREAYVHLAKRNDVDWARWHVFFGDERCVPPDHADSNFRMAHEALLAHVPIPETHVHRIEAEREDRQAAALDYETCLRGVLSNPGDPILDLVLLGIGEDGHTASIFPDCVELAQGPDLVVPVLKTAREPTTAQWRLTLTYPVLNAARCVAFLTAGSAKAPIVKRVFAVQEPVPLPAARVKPTRGDLVLLADHAASAQLFDS
jgi:6-phosphogluconolactonase